MRFIMPVILIGIAISVFFVFAVPIYNELSSLRGEVGAYNQALGNSKALENERDKLTAKYNSFNRDDLSKIEKLLPENVDNIRLILEIEQLATPYGMSLRDIKYDATETNPVVQDGAVVQGSTRQSRKEYGTLNMEFTTSGSYDNFINFTRDLENNLRIVDIAAVAFSSGSGTDVKKTSAPETYEYDFTIKTYWLKN